MGPVVSLLLVLRPAPKNRTRTNTGVLWNTQLTKLITKYYIVS